MPIGIDLCASGVKMVQLRRKRGEKLALVASARIELPSGAGADPLSETRVATLIKSITERMETGGFKGRKCVLAIDDRAMRVRSVRQPSMPDDEIQRAMELDARGRLGFSSGENAEFGWMRAGEVTQGDARGDEIILVGSRTEPLVALVNGLAKQGVRVMAIEPGFVSSARSFTRFIRRASEQNDVRALVDVGLRSTGVMLLRGRKVAFFKPLELGGEMMIQAASERLGLDVEAVSELRKQRMRQSVASADGVDPKVDRAIFESIRPIMSELAREVALCMRYYSVTFRGSRPRECLVIGGEAATPHFVDVLHEELRLPTSLGEPLKHVEATDGSGQWEPPYSKGGEFSVAAGCGMRLWEQSSLRRSSKGKGKAPTTRKSDGVIPRLEEEMGQAA